MTDLTKITTPFGLLDPETQEALRNCGGPWDRYRTSGNWRRMDHVPLWFRVHTYRQAPQPVTYPKIPWDHVDEKWQFWARDHDGVCMFYECRPTINGTVWTDNWGFMCSLGVFKLDPGTCDWRDSLVERPK